MSINTMSSKMVNIIILTQDENGNLYDQDGHLRNAIGQKIDAQRTVIPDANATGAAQPEFAAKHPHPPSPFYDKIDRSVEPTIDRQSESDVDRHTPPPIDRQAPLTYRVRLPSIDNDYINALIPPPKPLANPPEPKPNSLNRSPEPLQEEQETEGRRLRKRKEKIPKNLKRKANEKEMDGFTKRVLRVPIEKSFDEAYFTHRLWMFKGASVSILPRIMANQHGYESEYESEYETEYSESIDTPTFPSIDSNESTVTDDCNNTSLDVKHPVDHFAPPNHCYQHFAFQPPSKRGHDDYSIGSWADSGFHESFAVDTVITSPNEEHTEEYDEDYWKELVRNEKLKEGDFEIERSMSLGGSQWCRPMSMNSHRSTYHDEDRWTGYSSNRSTSSAKSTECNAVQILTHEEFAAKHPHPPSPFYDKINRSVDQLSIDRVSLTSIVTPLLPSTDRHL
ncbi:hypothetical protein DY000_02047998 [Brassica cretica]|uniref:Uncharacterized protein n=1 Tax=Brassica cretica TaxID=69181 RepID=A0ABQ7EPS0_BRACR|nr:hypothetical protein DY000_02047998 [Brassica cretica]